MGGAGENALATIRQSLQTRQPTRGKHDRTLKSHYDHVVLFCDAYPLHLWSERGSVAQEKRKSTENLRNNSRSPPADLFGKQFKFPRFGLPTLLGSDFAESTVGKIPLDSADKVPVHHSRAADAPPAAFAYGLIERVPQSHR